MGSLRSCICRDRRVVLRTGKGSARRRLGRRCRPSTRARCVVLANGTEVARNHKRPVEELTRRHFRVYACRMSKSENRVVAPSDDVEPQPRLQLLERLYASLHDATWAAEGTSGTEFVSSAVLGHTVRYMQASLKWNRIFWEYEVPFRIIIKNIKKMAENGAAQTSLSELDRQNRQVQEAVSLVLKP